MPPGALVGGGPSRPLLDAKMVCMGVREDCRHYLLRSVSSGDALQRCRLGVSQEDPFSCPEACLFFEHRSLDAAGWTTTPPGPVRMSNTAEGLTALPPAPKRKRGKKRR